MHTNMSPLCYTTVEWHYFLRTQYLCIQCPSASVMWNKTGWKNWTKFKKKKNRKYTKFRAVGVMWTCLDCNQMMIYFQRPGAPHEFKLWVYITDTLCPSHVQQFVLGRIVDQTWESRGNQAYFDSLPSQGPLPPKKKNKANVQPSWPIKLDQPFNTWLS